MNAPAMTGRRSFALAQVAAVAGLLVLGVSDALHAQEAEFTVHVSYDDVAEEVRPKAGRHSVPQKIAFTLLDERTLRVVLVRTHSFRTEAETSQVTLGVPGEGPFRNVRWSRSGDGATFVRLQQTASYKATMTVRIHERTCHAEIRFELMPGFSEYQMVRAEDPSEKVFVKTRRADRVKCWIGDFTVS